MRFPLGPGDYRDRLLDAMAWLLFDLHRGGVYWGDCSLANTLFRRDGDRIQAYLVDAETSEVHPSLSDGQREYDLEILVENVAFGLADLAALQGRDDGTDDAIAAAGAVVDRYRVLWDELHVTPDLPPGDRQALRRRIRRLNELGFSVDEIERRAVRSRSERAAAADGRAPLVPRPGAAPPDRDRRPGEPGPPAAQRPARVRRLAPVVRAPDASTRRSSPSAGRPRSSSPRSSGSPRWSGPDRDIVQAYCDLLEHKWLLSEQARRDIGMQAALDSTSPVRRPGARGLRARVVGPIRTVARRRRGAGTCPGGRLSIPGGCHRRLTDSPPHGGPPPAATRVAGGPAASCRGGRCATRSGRSRSSAPTRSRRSTGPRSGSCARSAWRCLGDRALDAFARGRRRGRPRARRSVRLDAAPGGGARRAARRREFTLHARNPEPGPHLRRRPPRLRRGRRPGLRRPISTAAGGPATFARLRRLRPRASAASTSSTRRAAARSSRPTCRSRPATSTCTGTFATLLDKSWQCLGARPDRRRRCDRGRLPRPRRRPRRARSASRACMTIINTNSPLRLDGPMGDGLIEMALHGQPVVATPFTLAGAMTPGVAGGRARPAERRGAVPGRPGPDRPARERRWSTAAFTSNVDMRTGAPAFGTPEYVKGALASGPARPALRAAVALLERDRLERRRRPGRLRVRDGGLGRGHGRRQPALPGGRLARGRADRLVREADRRRRDPPDDGRGPPADRRSTRPSSASTRSPRSGRAATSSGRPTRSSATRPRSTGRSLSDWRNFETWQADGARTATERANGIWKQLLAEYEPPPLDPPVADALDAFVARRKREIAGPG